MIRMWLGRIAAAAIAALLVFAVMHRGTYRSLLFDGAPAAVGTKAPDSAPDSAPDAGQDAGRDAADGGTADADAAAADDGR